MGWWDWHEKARGDCQERPDGGSPLGRLYVSLSFYIKIRACSSGDEYVCSWALVCTPKCMLVFCTHITWCRWSIGHIPLQNVKYQLYWLTYKRLFMLLAFKCQSISVIPFLLWLKRVCYLSFQTTKGRVLLYVIFCIILSGWIFDTRVLQWYIPYMGSFMFCRGI